jgi:site-specific DNA recombinase
MDRQGDERGVTRQLDDARALCAQRGWPIVREISDNDVSASGKRTRPGFEEALRAIADGEADALVAWALDRLTRNRRDTVRLIETCEKQGATISLVRGSDIDTGTPSGRLVADLLAATARAEIDTKSDRQRRATEQAALDGRRVGGRRPFGYDADGLTVRPGEAQAIRDGYDALLSGVPLARIAAGWNRRGLTTAQSGWKGDRRGVPSPWAAYSVRMVLRNPRNAGLRQHRAEIVGTAVWPPIVTEDIWRAAMALLDDPGRRNSPRSAQALLTGLALCGVCDKAGATVHRGRTRSGAATYRCRTSMGHISRQADPVDEFVGEVMIERLGRPDAADLLVDQDKPDLEAMRGEAVALRSRLDSLALDFAEGELTASQLRVATERARSKLGAVERAMADAGRVNVLGPLVSSGDVREAWTVMDTDRRRAVVDALCVVTLFPPGRGTRTFRPETVKIEWKG